jgi:hypothetical protein
MARLAKGMDPLADISDSDEDDSEVDEATKPIKKQVDFETLSHFGYRR